MKLNNIPLLTRFREMSKFKIYRSDLKNPRIVGKRNKWMIITLAVLYFLILIISNSSRNIVNNDTLKIINFILLGFGVITVLILVSINKSQFRRIHNIGHLEFKRSVIIKTIGDLRSEYPVDNIQSIELENHIRSVKLTDPRSAYLTYIIRINNKDTSYDQYIIAARSDDFRQKIIITDTLNLLKKLYDIDVRINILIKK
jgi:hypothetical protein